MTRPQEVEARASESQVVPPGANYQKWSSSVKNPTPCNTTREQKSAGSPTRDSLRSILTASNYALRSRQLSKLGLFRSSDDTGKFTSEPYAPPL
jgi:hypothetical protein